MTLQLSLDLPRPTTGPLVIVAGGASLIGFDWHRLHRFDVLAINMAYTVLPKAKFLWWTDFRFWEHHEMGLRRHPTGRRHAGEPLVKAFTYPKSSDVTVWKFTGTSGLETKAGCVRHGNNSGHAAINLGFHLGYDRMILLGYDMKVDQEGRVHWHADHPVSNPRPRTFEKMMTPHFDEIARELRDRGITVINANPDSALTVFDKSTPEELGI